MTSVLERRAAGGVVPAAGAARYLHHTGAAARVHRVAGVSHVETLLPLRTRHRRGPYRYALAVASVLVALALRFAVEPVLRGEAPLIMFIAPVMLASYFGGFGPGVLAAALGLIAGVYFFVTPRFAFGPLTPAELVRIAIFVTESLFITALNAALIVSDRRARSSERDLGASEERLL